MKKIIAVFLMVVLLVSMASCGPKVLTHDEYMAAELDTDVVIDVYVQATQSWWDNKITVYAADADGAYFIYEMTCSEEDAKKLTPGTKIRVTGTKIAWEGEVEIASGSTFEFIGKSDDTFVSTPADLTSLLGKDELIDHQNELALFKGMTVVKVEYQNGAPGKDIYVTLEKDGKNYDFCVESYLTFPDSEVYLAAGALAAGDVVDIEGFVYWYSGVNPHITKITKQ